MSKVLMVIAPGNFRDEEFFQPKEELEAAGHAVTVASRAPGEYTGKLGAKATAEISLNSASPLNFDAIVFVGGPGASEYFNDATALNLAKTFNNSNKVVAAICIAPCILANAGVLEGKKATVWSGQEYVENLRAKGAKFINEPVVTDGRIITANGPGAAPDFGKKIAEALK